MPKKKKSSSSLKNQSEAGDKSTIQQIKPVSKPGKIGKEIDDIFGGRKKKKQEIKEEETVVMKKTDMVKKKRKRNELDGGGVNKKPRNRPRKRTEDGLLVYTEDELGINKANAGDTSLCPFDCQCCF